MRRNQLIKMRKKQQRAKQKKNNDEGKNNIGALYFFKAFNFFAHIVITCLFIVLLISENVFADAIILIDLSGSMTEKLTSGFFFYMRLYDWSRLLVDFHLANLLFSELST